MSCFAVLTARAAWTAAGVLIAWALASSGEAQTPSGQQQPDSVVAAVAQAQGLASVLPQDQPPFGTYWAARNSLPCVTVPMPCPPADPATPVYGIAPGQYLADETAGPVVAPLAPPIATGL